MNTPPAVAGGVRWPALRPLPDDFEPPGRGVVGSGPAPPPDAPPAAGAAPRPAIEDRELFAPDALPFNLVAFFRLCLFITRDLHEHLFRRIIQHPDIPRDATWKRLRNAYWQAASALTGRGEVAAGGSGAGRGPDSVLDLPVLAQWLAVAADAMQAELETTPWGRALFPATGPGDLGGKELRRLLRLL